MSSTPFSSDNKKFTDKCHKLAQKLVYPRLFRVSSNSLDFIDSSLGESEKSSILDGQMAIDRIVKISTRKFNGSIEFTVQERFRKPNFARYKDITITEWNRVTNIPSELYKLNSGLFVYGYADSYPIPSGFIDVIVIDTAKLIIRIIRESIKNGVETNPRSNQTFITIPFSILMSKGCVIDRFVNIYQ